MWAQVICMFVGLAVMLAPGLLGFGQAAANNNYVVGPLIITFAMTAITDVARNLRWLNILCGAWLLLSSFLLDFEGREQWINIVCGITVIVLSCIKGKIKHRFGGGWRSLLQDRPLHMREVDHTQPGRRP